MELCRSLQCPQKTPDRTWHKLRTAPGIERTVCNKLQERRIPCYCPSVRVSSNTLFERKSSMFPGNVFAALTKKDLQDLSNEFLVEDIEKNQPDIAVIPGENMTIREAASIIAERYDVPLYHKSNSLVDVITAENKKADLQYTLKSWVAHQYRILP